VRENVRLRDSAARSQRSVGGIDRPAEETKREKLTLCKVSHRPQLIKSSIGTRLRCANERSCAGGAPTTARRVSGAGDAHVGTTRRGRRARFAAGRPAGGRPRQSVVTDGVRPVRTRIAGRRHAVDRESTYRKVNARITGPKRAVRREVKRPYENPQRRIIGHKRAVGCEAADGKLPTKIIGPKRAVACSWLRSDLRKLTNGEL
jgi:hypothetical protein